VDDNKLEASNTAREWLAQKPLFLDTETTGLKENDEVCQIAILDHAGNVLLESLVKPRLPIGAEAKAVHGITDEMVAYAPPMERLTPALSYLLCSVGLTVITYNVAFDARLIGQSLQPSDVFHQGVKWKCAMLLYAKFYGERDSHFNGYRWQRLGDAAQQCGIAVPGELHGARVDAEVARRILEHMARWQPPDLTPQQC
jgi:DNA polymerase-3 subunit epsilon